MITTITSGNFSVKIEGEVKPEKLESVIDAGITYVVQRDGLSAVYKALIPKDAEGDAAKRNAVAYSNANKAAFEAALEKALAPVGDFAVEVSQHVPGETASPMARATALVDSFLGTPMEAPYRLILQSEKGDRDELIKRANAQKLGIQPPKAAKQAKA